MPQVIVGSLFVLIVIIAGWLVGFYNKMTNRKLKAEEYWEEISDNTPEIIDAQIQLYNQAVTEYNQYLRRFPNRLASMILGVHELPGYQQPSEVD
ncbi:MAG: hypothetical protein APF84_16800 [Gracilibacter sp. BRH_c7a]|nr:MAG: hypothetical protein APF84_16800 [Gracilibacter sp. BRH_c7a]